MESLVKRKICLSVCIELKDAIRCPIPEGNAMLMELRKGAIRQAQSRRIKTGTQYVRYRDCEVVHRKRTNKGIITLFDGYNIWQLVMDLITRGFLPQKHS